MVELMVALALSATLLAGACQFLVAMRQSERTENALSRMQEAGRFALMYLTEDIQQAGYSGCASSLPSHLINNTLRATPSDFMPAKGIQGWNADSDVRNTTQQIALITTNTDWSSGDSTSGDLATFKALPGSDIIRVWGANDLLFPGNEGNILHIYTGIETTIHTSHLNIDDGDILLISNCNTANWVQACHVESNSTGLRLDISGLCTPGNKPNLTLLTEAGGIISKLTGNTYYVSKRSGKTDAPPSLFFSPLESQANTGSAIELVQGIANLQMLFGQNTNHDPYHSANVYITAANVSDWNSVVSVKINILVESIEDNLLPESASYIFAGNSYTPTDRKIRRTFTTTVNLRNRTL